MCVQMGLQSQLKSSVSFEVLGKNSVHIRAGEGLSLNKKYIRDVITERI